MLLKQLAHAVVFLASVSSAIHLHERHVVLEERNGYGGPGGPGGKGRGDGPPGGYGGGASNYQFAPGIQTAAGDTCGAAFGAGYETCREASGSTNRLCYNPDAGQKCCSSSWSCPNGSFCLSNGACCPNGMDPASCGAQPETTSSAAPSTSSAVPSSSAWSVKSVSHNATTSSWASQKTYASTLANVTSVRTTAVNTNTFTAPSSTEAALSSNNGIQASFSTAGLVGAGLLAVLATL